MLAKSAFERGIVIHRSGCVISHTFTVAPLSVPVWGNGCATLEQKARSLAKSVAGSGLRLLEILDESVALTDWMRLGSLNEVCEATLADRINKRSEPGREAQNQ